MTQASRPNYITSDTQIATGKIVIADIILTAGSDQATIDIYNEATSDKTASKKVMSLKVATNSTISFGVPFLLDEGCYADLSGSSPVATILIR